MQPNNPFKRKREIPGLFILILVLTLIPAALSPLFRGKSSAGNSPLVGNPAPALEFKDLQGHPQSLEGRKGKVVLLNFWASWCGPCMAEMDQLKEIERTMGPQGFELVALNIEEPAKDITQVLAGSSIPNGVYFEGLESQLQAYDVHSIPQSFLIDRQGVIQKHYRGALNWTSPRITKEFEGFLNGVGN